MNSKHQTTSSSNKLNWLVLVITIGTLLVSHLKAATIFDANFDNSPFTAALSSNAVTAVTDLGTPNVGTWSFNNLPVGRIAVNSDSIDKALAVGESNGNPIPNITEMADVSVKFGTLPDTEIADSGAGDVVKAELSQPGRFGLPGEQTRIKFDWGCFGNNNSFNFKYCFVTGYDSSGRQVFELLFQAGNSAADRNLYARSATDALTTLYDTSTGVPQGTAIITGIPDINMNSIGLKPSDLLKVTITLTNNQVTYGIDRGTLGNTLTFNLNSAATNITELRWSAIWNASRPNENKGYWLDNVSVNYIINSSLPADHLLFGQQPVNTAAGQVISPAVTVQVVDQFGNPTTSTTNVTISIGNNPGGGTLSGTLTVTATNGVAMFSDLSIDGVGNGYTFVVSANGLTGTNSTAFNITSRAWQSGLAFSYTDGTNIMPYRLYLPWNYNPATNYPLVLFLNGSGSAGTNNTAQVSQHIAGLVARTYSDYPAILVAPQSTSTIWWELPDAGLTFGLLAEVRRNYAVDDRRIYLTGLSNGGTGAGLYAYDYPTLFAAVSPMSCGIGFTPDNITANEPFTQIPTWLFHGSADTTLSVDYSRNYYMLVAGLTNITFTQTNYGYPTAVSGPIRYTEFTGKGHDIWELIYGATNTDFYDWMFSQTRPPATFTFAAASANGGTFIFGGSNSVPFATGYLLTTTNLQIPPSQWQCIATNWCDVNGNLMFTNILDANANQRFYILKLP
jgi:hypothetical protein